ncbi:MAG: hypothetical protein KME05_01885 [Gloeocapsa sp. UFS-A4-WI-NPMV-4B04]|jgi:hypothetical protein|nr:hypothetical protein [Gloeocapsa sp. UFS-A4-WI-NPMV-4B04]
MVLGPVYCPDCGRENVVKNGKTNEGKQRYLYRHQDCRLAEPELFVPRLFAFPQTTDYGDSSQRQWDLGHSAGTED